MLAVENNRNGMNTSQFVGSHQPMDLPPGYIDTCEVTDRAGFHSLHDFQVYSTVDALYILADVDHHKKCIELYILHQARDCHTTSITASNVPKTHRISFLGILDLLILESNRGIGLEFLNLS